MFLINKNASISHSSLWPLLCPTQEEFLHEATRGLPLEDRQESEK